MRLSPNPAKRLQNIVKKIFNEVPNQHSDKIALDVWANIFDVTRQDEFEIIVMLNECLKLIDKIEELLMSNDSTNNELYLEYLPKFRELFPIGNLHGNYWFFRKDVNSIHMKSLEFCVHAIDGFYSEKTVDEEEIEKVVEEIRSLYSIIKKSKLESKLKNLLLDMLRVMETSIHEYEIRGIERIDEAIEYLIGKIVLNKDLINKNETEETVNSFKMIFGKFLSIWAISSDSFGNIEGISKHIPLLPQYIEKAKEVGQNIIN